MVNGDCFNHRKYMSQLFAIIPRTKRKNSHSPTNFGPSARQRSVRGTKWFEGTGGTATPKRIEKYVPMILAMFYFLSFLVLL